MVLDWFGRSKQANIQGLIAQKDYGAAIAQIRAQLQKRKDDERLRVRLADVLAQAGRKDEAVQILTPLADDLALQGHAAKAISILKRINQLKPRDADVEEKLAYLIRQQLNPSAGPWRSSRREREALQNAAPSMGMEEIADDVPGMELAPEETTAPEPAAMAAAAEAPAAPAEPAPAPEEETAAPEKFEFDETFRDQLASLLEDVFTPSDEAAPATPGQAASPMLDTPLFKDFDQDELVAVIRGLQLRIFEPGEIIVSAGEPGESLFILTSGRVRAYMRAKEGHHVPLREMREGDFFGEISVLTGNPRSATVTAASNCDLLELDRKTLDEISATHPRVRDVLQEFYAQRASHSVKTAREQS